MTLVRIPVSVVLDWLSFASSEGCSSKHDRRCCRARWLAGSLSNSSSDLCHRKHPWAGSNMGVVVKHACILPGRMIQYGPILQPLS